MKLASSAKLLDHAKKNRYAIGCFNISNLEILQAVVGAAQDEHAPVILAVTQDTIKYAGIDHIVAMVKAASDLASIPISLHLDHGTSLTEILQCVRAGFDSVMYDGSNLSLSKNIAETREICKIVHPMNVSVEGEVGRIPKIAENIPSSQFKKFMTDPDEAARFAKSTGVDWLSISAGTVHGLVPSGTRPNMSLIKKIRDKVDLPLVLHGGSNLSDLDIKDAINAGISKVNIDLAIQKAFVERIRLALNEASQEIDSRRILGQARQAAKEIVKQKIQILGSAGKAENPKLS